MQTTYGPIQDNLGTLEHRKKAILGIHNQQLNERYLNI